MREILFRGKSKNDGEWYIGSLLKETHEKTNETTEIYKIKEFNIGFLDDWTFEPTYTSGFDEEVIPETVGQYTGLTDKTGKKIFENDIVSHFINYLGQRVHARVEYDNELASWMCNYHFENKKSSAFLCDWVDGNGAEIIGNEWDNQELLKGGEGK